MNKPIIALDVDDVLAAFTPHCHTYFQIPLNGKYDYWCEMTAEDKFGKGWFTEKVSKDIDFWKSLPRLSNPEDIDVDIAYYISAFPEELYEERKRWLLEHGFPDRPLIHSFNKLEKCIELGVTHLVDDKPATIQKLQGSPVKGIHFYTHYAGFNPVGNSVITNLNQIKHHI